MLTEEQYESLVYDSEGADTNAIWINLEEDFPDFDQRKETFFWVLNRLLEEGRARLASGDDYMKGTVDEQIAHFKRAFPSSLAEMARPMYIPEIGERFAAELWFFSGACPTGIVWPSLDTEGKEYFPDAKPLTDEQYLDLVETSKGAELRVLWLGVGKYFPDFFKRSNAFFWVLRRLLEEGRAKFLIDDGYMQGTVDEQIGTLWRAFPHTPELASSYEQGLFKKHFFNSVGIVWPLLDAHGKK